MIFFQLDVLRGGFKGNVGGDGSSSVTNNGRSESDVRDEIEINMRSFAFITLISSSHPIL